MNRRSARSLAYPPKSEDLFIHDRNIKGLFDLTTGFSPSETNRHGSVFFFPPFWIAACWSFDDEMLQSVQSLMLWISQLLPLVCFLLPVLLSQVRLYSLKFSISPRVDVQLFASGWALGQRFLYGTTSLGIKWEERGEKGKGEQYAGSVNSKCVLSQPHPILLPHTHTVTGS